MHTPKSPVPGCGEKLPEEEPHGAELRRFLEVELAEDVAKEAGKCGNVVVLGEVHDHGERVFTGSILIQWKDFVWYDQLRTNRRLVLNHDLP